MSSKKNLFYATLPLISFSSLSQATTAEECIASGNLLAEKKIQGEYIADIDGNSDNDLAATRIQASIALEAREACLRVNSQAELDVTLFEQNIDVATIIAGATAAAEEQLALDTLINVLGTDLVSQELTLPEGVEPIIEVSLPPLPIPDYNFQSTNMALGPFSLGLNVGISPEVTVDLVAGYKDVGLFAYATPYAEVNAFADASLQWGFFSLLVGADIALAEDTLSLEASAQWEPENTGVDFGYSIVNDAKLVGGSIYGSINDNTPVTFIEWPGFTYNNVLTEGSTLVSIVE